jgi:hypothetical protein
MEGTQPHLELLSSTCIYNLHSSSERSDTQQGKTPFAMVPRSLTSKLLYFIALFTLSKHTGSSRTHLKALVARESVSASVNLGHTSPGCSRTMTTAIPLKCELWIVPTANYELMILF